VKEAGCLIGVVFSALIGIGAFLSWIDGIQHRKAIPEGAAAFAAGASDSANPYQGARGMIGASKGWLEGYLAAKSEASK